MKTEIARFVPAAKAIVSLLYPHAEVVLHDLRHGKIAAIFNNFSRRKVGDDSHLEDPLDLSIFPDFFEPYFKTNWDGKRLKSSTATIKNEKGEAVGLLCINLDISSLDGLQKMILELTGDNLAKALPKHLFKDDWQEKISGFIHSYLKKEGKTVKSLSKEERKKLIQQLQKEGAFHAKNAALHIGNILGVSRATVYKNLME